MKMHISALSVFVVLLAGCSTTTPATAPTPIDGPSSAVATPTAGAENPSAQASTPTGTASASEAGSAQGEASTKPASSTKPQTKPSSKPSDPGTVVSSEKDDTTRDGGPIDIAPSVDSKGTANAASAGAFISVTSKESGKGTITLKGKADVPEGTVIATAVHKTTGSTHTQHTTASCSMGCTGDWTITFTKLAAGDYTVTVAETDDSDGEGQPPFSLTILMTVK